MTPRKNMVQKLLLLLTACFMVCVAAPCSAMTTRGEVFLESATVTLGDLFLNAGDKAGLVIGEAPQPGKKTVYDASSLLRIAQNANFDWKPDSNYERVTVIRASQSVNADMIKTLVSQDLAKQLRDKEMDIALDNNGLEIFRAKNEPLHYHLSDVKFDPVQNRFETNLIVEKSGGSDAEIVRVTGRAMPMVQVATLSHAISTGDVLGAQDIDWTKIPADKAGADAITDISRITGTEAKRSMTTGSIVRLRDVRGARLVTKGSLITISVETANMSLTAQGRAVNDGAMGDTVQVINTQSNRTIDAIVIGSSKVSVSPVSAPAQIAAK